MEITFVDSIQGHQTVRLRDMAERLRKTRPDLKVEVVEGDAAKALLARHKLNFGPAIVIDARLEYVGIPRWRFLQERIAQIRARLPNPRSAVPPTPSPPVKTPGSPTQPIVPIPPASTAEDARPTA